jgi:hypothetical protein
MRVVSSQKYVYLLTCYTSRYVLDYETARCYSRLRNRPATSVALANLSSFIFRSQDFPHHGEVILETTSVSDGHHLHLPLLVQLTCPTSEIVSPQ